MTRRVYDSRLLQLFAHAHQRFQAYSPDNRMSAHIKPLALEVLGRGHARLEAAVASSGDESREAGEAREALARVEDAAGAVFRRVYHALVADHHARAAHGDSAQTSHTVALDRFVNGHAPASFHSASSATRVEVMGEAARLAGHFLRANWAQLADEVDQSYARMTAAVAAFQAETGEADAAMLARDTAFEAARVEYQAARDLIAAALRLDAKHELLAKWAPPVSEIRATRGARGAAEPTDASAADTLVDNVLVDNELVDHEQPVPDSI